MAKVTAFEIPGLATWFWSMDHEPPHFHAKRAGEWEVRVRFLLDSSEMIEVVWNKAPLNARLRRQLVSLAESHRGELLAQWDQIHRDDEE